MSALTSPEIHARPHGDPPRASRAFERGRPSFPDEAVRIVNMSLGTAPGHGGAAYASSLRTSVPWVAAIGELIEPYTAYAASATTA